MDNIKQLLSDCRSGDPSLQVAAAMDLSRLKVYSAVPTIVELLSSPDATVRVTSVEALGELGKSEPEIVGPALMNLLDDSEDIVRSEVTDALSRLRYMPAVERIKFLLHYDPDPIVRASAAEALGNFGDDSAVANLESALHDPDESVRAYAALSIGLLAKPGMLPKLETYIEAEQSLRARAELLGASYRLGAPANLKRLLNLLDTADETLAVVILNILTDLTERRVPSMLAADAARIVGVLAVLTQRLPILRPHAEEIVTNLIHLTKPD